MARSFESLTSTFFYRNISDFKLLTYLLTYLPIWTEMTSKFWGYSLLATPV